MFDQSFSAKNIETVFNVENRKGHIDFARMPQAYRDIVSDIHAFRNEMKAYNQKKKALWTDADERDYELDWTNVNLTKELGAKVSLEVYS